MHMADTPASLDTGDQSGVGPNDRGSTTGTPRWVKAFALIALVVVVLFVVLNISGGEHGPSRHTPGGGADTPGDHTGPPPGATHGDRQP
jgi:hypothetical protein